jgi:hypothetical protein
VKIGEAISSIEFSAAEKNRLAVDLRDQASLAYRVMRGKALEIRDPDFWRWTQKNFQVLGFRPGHRAAKEIVLRKALDSLKGNGGSYVNKIWPLYCRCVTDYVVEDLAELNALLKEENLLEDRDASLTDRVFRSIRRALPLYDARDEQIRELYVLWGFERTSKLEVILSDGALDAEVARRLIRKEGRTATAQTLARVGELRADLQNSMRQEATAVTSHLREEMEALKASLLTSINAVGERVATLAAELQDVEQKLSQPNHGSRIRNDDGLRERDTGDDRPFQSLKSKVESLVGNVNRHQKLLAELLEGKRHPASRRPIAQECAESWEAALTRCLAACREAGFEVKLLGAVRILIELLRRSRVILSARETLPLRLISACEPTDVRQIAASPLWIDASDWRSSLEFVSDFGAPTKILVVLDFDIALQDSYLVPALRTWMAAIPSTCRNRIVLVPTLPSLENVSSRVLELCNAFQDSTDFLSDLDRLARTIDPARTNPWSTSKVSQPLGFCQSYQREHEAQIQQIVSNLGSELPSPLAERFISLVAGLQEIGIRECFQVASESVLLPWIRRIRGDGAARLLSETLGSQSGIA